LWKNLKNFENVRIDEIIILKEILIKHNGIVDWICLPQEGSWWRAVAKTEVHIPVQQNAVNFLTS
jgi:hypothetical protein